VKQDSRTSFELPDFGGWRFGVDFSRFLGTLICSNLTDWLSSSFLSVPCWFYRHCSPFPFGSVSTSISISTDVVLRSLLVLSFPVPSHARSEIFSSMPYPHWISSDTRIGSFWSLCWLVLFQGIVSLGMSGSFWRSADDPASKPGYSVFEIIVPIQLFCLFELIPSRAIIGSITSFLSKLALSSRTSSIL